MKQKWISAIRSRLNPECEKIEETSHGLAFLVSNISQNEAWKVFGHVSFLPSGVTESEDPELMQLEWIVLEHVSDELRSQVEQKLHDLSNMTTFGYLAVNPYKDLVYHHSCPVAGHTADEVAALFEFIADEMLSFLDIYYPYLLVCLTDPERLTPDNYLEQLTKGAFDIFRQENSSLQKE